ncbi:MAG: FMN-binding protein, partial [Fusobacterium periodonticum]|nr:FMN-binding protein [Fusobacterium periodonticum]
MKKYLLIGMVVALSLLTACGKKDFSKMTFNDGEYQGHFNNDDKDHPSTADVVLTIQDGKIVACTAEFRDGKGNIKGDDYGKEAGDEKYKKAQIAVEGFSTYADKLVEVQDPNEVDAVSGATVSNKEFKEA